MSIAPNAVEIRRLHAVAEPELADASVDGLSADGSFDHAYIASLTLATIVVRASGERVHGPDPHRITFERLGAIADGRWTDLADYLQHCRRRRNTSVYDVAGSISQAEAVELREQAALFLREVIEWMRSLHPELQS